MAARGIALLMVTATLAACHSTPRLTPTTELVGAPVADRLAHARVDLDRWDAAAAATAGRRFRPTSPTLLVLGPPTPSWAPTVSVMALAAQLGLTPGNGRPFDPALAQVRWADGRAVAVDVMSADDAAYEITTLWAAPAMCGDCPMLTTHTPRLVTETVDTDHGPATAPFWSWTVKGSDVRVERLAVRMPTGIVPPHPVTAVYGAVQYMGVLVSPDGRVLTVNFIGEAWNASRLCGHDYTAVAVESAYAVVPVVIDRRHAGTNIPCERSGWFRTATVTLAAPLGERTVLSDVTGLPVPTNYS